MEMVRSMMSSFGDMH